MRIAIAITIAMIAGPTLELHARVRTRDYLKQQDEWFRSDEGRRIAANIITYQSRAGSWPKNTDLGTEPYGGDPAKLHGTFDNSATTDELRFLARAFVATGDATDGEAFFKGLDCVLKAQYPNGGWPQSYPPGRGYDRHITFNDDAMIRIMNWLREVATSEAYRFVDAPRRTAAKEAFDRGVGCILKAQIRVGGKPTVWCAQHDEIDLSPRPARSYELPSFSGAESVQIVRLLMSLDDPSPDVVESIERAIVWFEAAKLNGIRVEERADPLSPSGKNKVVVPDPTASSLWARFYDLKTNRPMFVDRDGIMREHLADIGYERRNGYAWLGDWPRSLLERDYPTWKKKLAAGSNR